MKVFRNLFSAGILAVVLMNFLFIGACKKKEDDDDQNNAILLWLATRPYVEQSKTGFLLSFRKGSPSEGYSNEKITFYFCVSRLFRIGT